MKGRLAMNEASEHALEQQARRAARLYGLEARKTRWRRDSMDNLGGFALIDPKYNGIVAGSRFDLTAEDVLAYCKTE